MRQHISTKQWNQMKLDAIKIRWTMFEVGLEPTKPDVEMILMDRYPQIDHADARSVMNSLEMSGEFHYMVRQRRWVGSRLNHLVTDPRGVSIDPPKMAWDTAVYCWEKVTRWTQRRSSDVKWGALPPIYKVVKWGSGETVCYVSDLNQAKKIARGLGHTGNPHGKTYPPVARVDEPMQDHSIGWGVRYNPRFSVGVHDGFKPTPVVHQAKTNDNGERPFKAGAMRMAA